MWARRWRAVFSFSSRRRALRNNLPLHLFLIPGAAKMSTHAPEEGDGKEVATKSARRWQRSRQHHAACVIAAATALVAGCMAVCLLPLGPAASSLLTTTPNCACTSQCRPEASTAQRQPAISLQTASQNGTQCNRDPVAGRMCECLVQGAPARRAPRSAADVAAMGLADVRRNIVTELSNAGLCRRSDCSAMKEQALADLCLPCAQGYLQLPGSRAAVTARETVLECSQCADQCSQNASCKSYECSKAMLQCVHNSEAQPMTPAGHKDFDFCSKESAVLPELSKQGAGRHLLQDEGGCDCSRCQDGTESMYSLLKDRVAALARQELRQRALLKDLSDACADAPNWVDPVGGKATCGDWDGFDCSLDFGDQFSPPAIVKVKCPRTCGLCSAEAPEDQGAEAADRSSSSIPNADPISASPQAPAASPAPPSPTPAPPAPTVIRYVDGKSGEVFYGPAHGGQRVFRNPWENRYDDPFGFKESAIIQEAKARKEWSKFDAFIKLQKPDGVEQANAQADVVATRRPGLSSDWIRRLPPLVYRENHWFKKR